MNDKTPLSVGGGDDDIRQQKQALRKKLRAAMKELSAEDIQEQSARVWERITQLNVYQNAKTVGLFLSMPTGEITTDDLLDNIFSKFCIGK